MPNETKPPIFWSSWTVIGYQQSGRIVNWCFVFIFLGIRVISDAQEVKYFQFDTDDGLPSSELYDIEIDTNGLIWIATDRGICTFDGYEFNTYTTQDGLADNTNFQIFQDSKGSMIFSGFSGKLTEYKNGEFSELPLKARLCQNYSKKGVWFYSFFEDDLGNVWAGYNRFTREYFDLYDIHDELLPIHGNSLRAIKSPVVDSIYILDNFKGALLPFIVPVRYNINELFEVKYFSYEFRESWKINGYYFIDNGACVIKYDHSFQVNDYLCLDEKIQSIKGTTTGDLIVSTSNGIIVFQDGDFRKVTKLLEGYYVSNTKLDREGNLWVCTINSGLILIPSSKINWYECGLNSVKNKIMSIASNENYLVFGDSRANFFIFNEDLVLHSIIDTEDKRQITKIYLVDGVFRAPYLILDPLQQNPIETSNLASRDFMKLRNGDYMKSHFSKYAIGSKQSINSDTNYYSKDLMPVITFIEQDSFHTIWLGTMDGLYYIEDYEYDNPQKLIKYIGRKMGRVNRLSLDKYHNLWISTIGNGLFCWSRDTLFHWNSDNGLNSDIVNDAIVAEGRLYVATNKGLNHAEIHYDSISRPIIQYFYALTSDDGLASNFINELEFWKGHLWLATNKGVNSFEPEDIRLTYPTVPVFIHSFSLRNEVVDLDSVDCFSHDQNDITITYAGVSFRKPPNLPFYRYRLSSNDNISEWQETNENSLRFNDLSHGEYLFEVQARNKLNQWSQRPATIKFEIQPHFTQTTWFLSLLWLALGGVVFLAVRWRVNNIKKRSEREQQLTEAHLKTRESELALLRNQMNPHFVFNALNSIQNYVFKQETEQANYFLSNFSSLIRKSLNFSKKRWISLNEEVKYLKQYLEMETLRFPDRFSYRFTIDKSLDPMKYYVPTLLLQPVVENSIKHGFKNIAHKGKLQVDITKRNRTSMMITIEDNGEGVDSEKLEHSYSFNANDQPHGLQIVRDRIDYLKEDMPDKEFSLIFRPAKYSGNGLRTVFVLPLIYRDGDESSSRR